MDDWDVFYYDEENEQVCSLSKYHAENCSVEPLVEAHPDVIYFYASLTPHRGWDFNKYVLPHSCSCHVNKQPCGLCSDLGCTDGLPLDEHIRNGL